MDGADASRKLEGRWSHYTGPNICTALEPLMLACTFRGSVVALHRAEHLYSTRAIDASMRLQRHAPSEGRWSRYNGPNICTALEPLMLACAFRGSVVALQRAEHLYSTRAIDASMRLQRVGGRATPGRTFVQH
ncbi:hypothetical protein RRG08_013305 [Elysia crispata]|uniref:Uncharacterized protein n=1 Tax=Elysia crispata TaxID=231223 RepID=A0AAE1AXL0_9GAST|nr:hypothetical protein RRG08_013305 [Elysia crispata]